MALTAALLAGALLLQPSPQDTLPHIAPGARDLLALAMRRHAAQDSLVRDYQARFTYRLTLGIGRRAWGTPPIAAAEEQAGRVQWAQPNDLRVDIEGRRTASRNPAWRPMTMFDAPWFVPRGLGDSVRVFGSDFPEVPAVHPLSPGGPAFYRYAAGDTLQLGTGERTLRLARLTITPRRVAPSLVAGTLWIDLATGDVVRFTFRYVGTGLWSAAEGWAKEGQGPTKGDSTRAARANTIVNRILSLEADLEYARQEGQHWMPYRQVLSGQVRIPIVSDVVFPFEATTTFEDYELNTGAALAFELQAPEGPPRHRSREAREARADSLRLERRGRLGDSLTARVRGGSMMGGGRYEIRRAPRDSLRAWTGWDAPITLSRGADDEARLREAQQDLARLAEGLDRRLTGIQTAGIAYERLADLYRFNRVQGSSVGLGYRVRLPSIDFTSLHGTARYGLSDGRLLLRGAVIREAPTARLTLAGYRDLMDADPLSPGLTIGNSMRALWFGRDEADYYEARGGAVMLERAAGRGVDLTLAARVERQSSVKTQARSALNDLLGGSGDFLPNAPIIEGTYGLASVRLEGPAGRGSWFTVGEVLVGNRSGARVVGHARQLFGPRGTVQARATVGLTTADPLPQLALRAGGSTTVRGFEYGAQRGEALWALQLDWTPARGALRPVLFVDAGQAGSLTALSRQRLLVGGGAGLSLLGGAMRVQLTAPFVAPRTDPRLEIVFGSLRW